MANIMPQIAQMLGVEIGEEFKVKGEDELTYRFDSDGLQVTYGCGIEISHISINSAFVALVKGQDEVVKLSWKPKEGEKYWTFSINDEDALDADWSVWHDDVDDFARLKAGWVYRTEEEAKVELSKAAAEMGVDYEP